MADRTAACLSGEAPWAESKSITQNGTASQSIDNNNVIRRPAACDSNRPEGQKTWGTRIRTYPEDSATSDDNSVYGSSISDLSHSLSCSDSQGSSDERLNAIIKAWPAIPDAIKTAIMSLMDLVGDQNLDDKVYGGIG